MTGNKKISTDNSGRFQKTDDTNEVDEDVSFCEQDIFSVNEEIPVMCPAYNALKGSESSEEEKNKK